MHRHLCRHRWLRHVSIDAYRDLVIISYLPFYIVNLHKNMIADWCQSHLMSVSVRAVHTARFRDVTKNRVYPKWHCDRPAKQTARSLDFAHESWSWSLVFYLKNCFFFQFYSSFGFLLYDIVTSLKSTPLAQFFYGKFSEVFSNDLRPNLSSC